MTRGASAIRPGAWGSRLAAAYRAARARLWALLRPAPAEPQGTVVPVASATHSLRPAVIPVSLDDLGGPDDRVIELPETLCWSVGVDPAERAFDMRDETDQVLAYGYVLEAGGLADLKKYLNPRILASVWDQVPVEKGKRTAWEAAFPVLARDRQPGAA